MNSPEELANAILQEIKDSNGEIQFPICPFKILKNKNVMIALRSFENLSGVIINDKDNDIIT